jgi:predicted nucleic acid-binding protein
VILVDTNVLYALADRRDKHHARCADWLRCTPDVLMVPATVLAETCYLIDRTLAPRAEAAFLDSVGMGPDSTFQLVELVDSDLRRMAGLVRQYADLRLGGTDASVIAICERLGIVTVATVNLRDFATVRPRHIPAFITVPGLN